MAFESRTVEITEAGRVEVIRSPTNGITATVEVNSTAVTSKVEPDGRVAVTVARGGTTIWQYELGSPRPMESQARDENAELRREAEAKLAPAPRKRGRPPSAIPLPRRSTTLADVAQRQDGA